LLLNNIYTARPLYSLANSSFNGILFRFRNIALWILTPRAGLYAALPVVVVTVFLVFKSLAFKHICTVRAIYSRANVSFIEHSYVLPLGLICLQEYIGANSHRSCCASNPPPPPHTNIQNRNKLWMCNTDSRNEVVNTPASYSVYPGFNSRHGDRLYWLIFFVFSLSPSRQVLEMYLKVGDYRLFPINYSLIILSFNAICSEKGQVKSTKKWNSTLRKWEMKEDCIICADGKVQWQWLLKKHYINMEINSYPWNIFFIRTLKNGES
jgi:hypothetical protein